MLCEMCGKDVSTWNRVRIEGSLLLLCADCSRFGTVVAGSTAVGAAPVAGAPTTAIGERLLRSSRRMEERDLFRELPDLELAPDWAKRIRVAREKLAWTPEDLAKKLNEKKSIILKIESGAFHPPDAMIPKIEHLLKVRLRAEPSGSE